MSENPTVEVTDDTFDEVVLRSERPVVVDYWAEWCGPCTMMRPIVEEVAAAHPEIAFATMDTMANPATPGRYGIMAIPTFHVFNGGELVHTFAGARPKKKFVEEILRRL